MSTIKLSHADIKFLSYLRSLSIFVIVFGHVGGFWVYRPYSEFLHVFVPMFFFISGAVSIYSFNRSQSVTHYYAKRFAGLLIPYYLLCLLSLLVYFIMNRTIPSLEIANLLKWSQIRPTNDIMPFPIGQVWFLHTLFIITLVSPLYFLISEKNKVVITTVMIVFISVSGMPLLFDIGDWFSFFGNNLYGPLVHSSFYIFGIICFSSSLVRSVKFMSVILIPFAVLSIVLPNLLNLDIDYAIHAFPPDLYYVSGSFCTILIFLIFQKYFILVIEKNRFVEYGFRFFYKHTFSIFLLHTFGIYISETIGGLVEPQKKTIAYGVIKLIVVLIITCVISVPFTKISSIITKAILNIQKKPNKSLNPTA